MSVNEETENSSTAPGGPRSFRRSSSSLIYVLVDDRRPGVRRTVDNLVNNPSDVFAPLGKGVFGSRLDKMLIIAILTSASASTQTTILPTARTTLSMGRAGAIPKQFGERPPALPLARASRRSGWARCR